MEKKDLIKAKIIDKIRQYEKTGEITCTCFLTPSEIIENKNLFEKMDYSLRGIFEEAERKVLIVGTEDNIEEDFLDVLEITSNKPLGHREVLGSILGIGIKREVLVDIFINDNIANVVVLKDITKYILQNLEKVGREKVKVKKIKKENIIEVKPNFTEFNTSVASLRLDAIISACYGIARGVSTKLVEAEKVNVNYVLTTNASKQIKEKDLISVRGFGRFTVEEIVGETRKGRIRISIKKS